MEHTVYAGLTSIIEAGVYYYVVRTHARTCSPPGRGDRQDRGGVYVQSAGAAVINDTTFDERQSSFEKCGPKLSVCKQSRRGDTAAGSRGGRPSAVRVRPSLGRNNISSRKRFVY